MKRTYRKHDAILTHWIPWLISANRFDSKEDAEGCCFACGVFVHGNLERSHITARCDGGADDVENLHLLCSWCHKASEYITGPDYFRWFEVWSIADACALKATQMGLPIVSALKGNEKAMAFCNEYMDRMEMEKRTVVA